jgi:hypothetical protein
MTFQPLPQSPKASQPDSVTATVSSNLTSRRQRVSRASRWKVPVFSPARWRQQRAKPSQGTFSAVSLEQRAEKSLLGHFLDTFSVLLLWQKSSGFISDPCSRADSQLKKGRSPPRPLRPLARGEQTPRSACRPEAGQAVFIHVLRLHPHAVEPLKAACSLRFPFVFLLDFLLVVPDIEGHFGKKIKKI